MCYAQFQQKYKIGIESKSSGDIEKTAKSVKLYITNKRCMEQ